MSTGMEIEASSRSFADVIGPLLKEYSLRLQAATDGLIQRAQDFSHLENEPNSPEKEIAERLIRFERQRIRNLLPGIERLARQTSQQLDHGILDELSKIELKARLADLEALLNSAKDATTLF
jgi:hypothetical protein